MSADAGLAQAEFVRGTAKMEAVADESDETVEL